MLQQVLERLQAGLEIADPEALKEYIDSFIGGAVLGGTIAPIGRGFERAGAKRQAAEADRTVEQQRRTEQTQQQQAEKQAAIQAEQDKKRRQQMQTQEVAQIGTNTKEHIGSKKNTK